MPVRPFSRDKTWLLPPTLEELIPVDHPARFVAAFVDALDRKAWAEMGISLDGEMLGAAAYHPRVSLGVWVYGFITGVRSSRKLEAACRDQLPYLWLTGWQVPDHNTLWRFYQDHREQMRQLLKRTVRTAIGVGLVDLAVQAVDGTKIKANAARRRTYDKAELEKLLERTDKAIREMEAQNVAEGEESLPKLPKELTDVKELQEKVKRALAKVVTKEGPKHINLTDEDAGQVKGKQGVVTGYNAQAMVSPLNPDIAGRGGQIITAVEVTNEAYDHGQLVPMLEKAREMTGKAAEVTLADGGYHSGANLEECEKRGEKVLMAESQKKQLKNPYHKDNFRYDKESDSYTCPQGQILRLSSNPKRKDRPQKRVYRSTGATCRTCPAFGECTKERRQGRGIEIGPQDDLLRRHRALMATAEAKAAYAQRKQLPEPTFGIMKEEQGARRFLLRGIKQVLAEWTLLATAFNLRTLYRVWKEWTPEKRGSLVWVTEK